MAAVNVGHVTSYGYDPTTDAAVARFRQLLGEQVEVRFVFNGTGANVVGLQSLLHTWESVVCSRTAHIHVDECGAPERHLGSKLLPLDTPDGKLTPDQVHSVYTGIGDEHRSQPRVVSITQSTEVGTVYTPDEVRALADTAHALDMYLHMDGARICNAAASLGVELRETTADCGVDVLSFGGTKNGIVGGEAVVFFRPELAVSSLYVRKQEMQLASKMRFISAQFLALLEDDLWRHNATHANAMARRLAESVRDVPGVSLTQRVQANGVFAVLPAQAIPPLQEEFHFYEWDPATHECRWMCSWDTTTDDVDGFAAAIAELAPRYA
jgi:threonine aldolase